MKNSNSKIINSQNPEIMERTENLTQKSTKNLVMTQVDYLKIKVENVRFLDTHFLKEHPTIKNRYKLAEDIVDFNGNTLHGDNIDIYFNNKSLYLDTSIGYLIHGHNYTEITSKEVSNLMQLLTIKLGVNLFEGRVTSFEVAKIFHPEKKFNYLSKVFQGIDEMELQKKNGSFIAFGKGNEQFKFYKVSANLKRKADTRKLIKNEEFRKAVKTEIKFTNDKRYTLQQFIDYGIEENHKYLMDLLENQCNYSTAYTYSGKKFDDVLFLTILKLTQTYIGSARQEILDMIDRMELSYTCATARRNSLKKKLELYEATKVVRLLDLLENNLEDAPLWKDYRTYRSNKAKERMQPYLDRCTEPAF